MLGANTMSHSARPAPSTEAGLHGWGGLEQLYPGPLRLYALLCAIWTLERPGRYTYGFGFELDIATPSGCQVGV